MSSITAPGPDFRLTFGDDAVRFTRSARSYEEVPLAAPDLVERLRVLGRERTAARARLTAILPAGAIWETVLVLPRWNPTARRRAVRAAAAAGLDLAPSDLAIALGRRRADGSTLVAAVPAARLAETRAFLAPLGLAPDRIVAAGSLIGFRGRPGAMPFLPPFELPQLSIDGFRLPAGLLAPLQRQMPPAPLLLGAGGLMALAAVGFALMPGERPAPLTRSAPIAATPAAVPDAGPVAVPLRTAAMDPAPRHRPEGLRHLALASALAPREVAPIAALSASPAAGTAPRRVHVTMGTRNLPLAPLEPLPAARRGDSGPRDAELGRAALTDAAAPRHRPGLALTATTPARIAAPSAPELGADLRPRWRPARSAVPSPDAPREAALGAAAAASLAAVVLPEGRPEPRPLRASGLAPVPAVAAAGTPSGAGTRPAPRSHQLPRQAAADPAAFVSAGRPVPRQEPVSEPVKVASLAPASDVSALPARVRVAGDPPAPVGTAVRAAVAAAATMPASAAPVRSAPVTRVTPVRRVAPVAAAPAAATPARSRPAAPVPQRVASLQPAKAAPVPARSLPLAPAAPVVAVPRATPVTKVAPARAKPVVIVPRATPVTKVTPAKTKPVLARKAPAKPQRTARAEPVQEKVGLSRRGASLIGVFGDADGRYALVQTGRGKVTRVKAGDSVDGAIVAAIGKDSVQLDGRRDTILRLPN